MKIITLNFQNFHTSAQPQQKSTIQRGRQPKQINAINVIVLSFTTSLVQARSDQLVELRSSKAKGPPLGSRPANEICSAFSALTTTTMMNIYSHKRDPSHHVRGCVIFTPSERDLTNDETFFFCQASLNFPPKSSRCLRKMRVTFVATTQENCNIMHDVSRKF